MRHYYTNEPYKGAEAIIVAMDIGTTQTAVSLAHFFPGIKTQIRMVTLWPKGKHDNVMKIPSLVSYQKGKVKACGAEAVRDLEEQPQNVACWFKLHLHPAAMATPNSQRFEIPPLPIGVTIERVYADFMRYLLKNTQQFFEATVHNGKEIWGRVRDTIVIVLATPNGWELREQSTLRKAAIKASLVTEGNADQLLQFVTEAEASVHYALANQSDEWLKEDTKFAVVDCGGSTIDTTIYQCTSIDPLRLNEACPSECIQAGGIFVDREIEKMLKERLLGSSFDDPEIIRDTVKFFEDEVKPYFDGIMAEFNFKIGSVTDNDPSREINKGQIAVCGEDLKRAFDAVIDRIIESCFEPLTSKVKYVLLVGGFAESPYVRRVLQNIMDPKGIQTIVAGDYSMKAAAGGAMIGRTKQLVIARAVKATFGGCVRQNYDKKLHSGRKNAAQPYPDGKMRVDGAFHVWVKKGAILLGTLAHKLSYHVAWDAVSTSRSELVNRLGTTEVEVFAWEGDDCPIWCKDERGVVLNGMRHICTLNANLSALAGGLQIKDGPRGTKFYRVDYDVCIYFGGTQLHAKLQWKEKGLFCEGPVTVIPSVA